MVPKFSLSSVAFLSEWCLKAASNALKVLWYALSSCTLRKSYFMRINIGSKSVLEAEHILSGFRLGFNYASFAWKLFCKRSERLHHLSLIMSCLFYVGSFQLSYMFKDKKSGCSVGISIIFLKSFKSFNSYCEFLLFSVYFVSLFACGVSKI